MCAKPSRLMIQAFGQAHYYGDYIGRKTRLVTELREAAHVVTSEWGVRTVDLEDSLRSLVDDLETIISELSLESRSEARRERAEYRSKLAIRSEKALKEVDDDVAEFLKTGKLIGTID